MADVLLSRLLKVSVEKEAIGAPGQIWMNSYEVDLGAGNALDTMLHAENLADAFMYAEQMLHLDIVHFVRVRISTWTPDGVPYDPESFIEFPYTTRGTLGADGDPCERSQVLWLSRGAVTGREGKIFIRGSLSEGSVDASETLNPLITPSSAAEYNDIIFDAFALIMSALNAIAAEAVMALISKIDSYTIVRPVFEWALRGVTTVPAKHKWFNRS